MDINYTKNKREMKKFTTIDSRVYESNKIPTPNLDILPDVFVEAFREYVTICKANGEYFHKFKDIYTENINSIEDVFSIINSTYYKGLEIKLLKHFLSNMDSYDDTFKK